MMYYDDEEIIIELSCRFHYNLIESEVRLYLKGNQQDSDGEERIFLSLYVYILQHRVFDKFNVKRTL